MKDRLNKTIKEYGMNFNTKKTKVHNVHVMQISRGEGEEKL